MMDSLSVTSTSADSALQALRFDLGHGVLQAVHVDIGNHHGGAVLRQRDAGGPAKPAAATDDDHLAAVEPEQGPVVGHVDAAAVPRRIWIKEESSARPSPARRPAR